MPSTGFLAPAPMSDEVAALYKEDIDELGYVMNGSRAWGYQPRAYDQLFELLKSVIAPAGLSLRQRGVLVAATASTYGDSYCSLAWGSKLAMWADPDTAGAVLCGDDAPLDATERALARWARQVAHDPSATSAGDLAPLRDAGFDDAQIFGITAYVALRIAFSTVNDALGAEPDQQYLTTAPAPVLDAVTWGRPIADTPSAAE